jgi:hypothetical protein
MTCVCGHSDDLHSEVDNDEGNSSYEEFTIGSCTACECIEFCEDIDRDELEVE